MYTLGELRRALAQIGTGHDDKPVKVLLTGNAKGEIAHLMPTIHVQGDRILIEAGRE